MDVMQPWFIASSGNILGTPSDILDAIGKSKTPQKKSSEMAKHSQLDRKKLAESENPLLQPVEVGLYMQSNFPIAL